MKLAPIILFAYNRPEHTRLTLEALALNHLAKQSLLYIHVDGYKSKNDKDLVEETRRVAKNPDGFSEVFLHFKDRNLGLAQSIIQGVSEVMSKHGRAIILEDDIITSRYFLSYMNEALNFYEKDENIFTVSGYHPPIAIPKDYRQDIYLSRRGSSWGWATWEDRWLKGIWQLDSINDWLKDEQTQNHLNERGADLIPMLKSYLKGEIDSWAIRWAYTQAHYNAYSIVPVKSLVHNIGTDGSGTHFKSKTRKYNTKLQSGIDKLTLEENLVINEKINASIKKLVAPSLKNKLRGIIRWIFNR
ncbi:MAG: sugar transferase [Cyclobacteriaceae bacterium]